MKTEKHRILFALKDDKLVSVDDVDRGLECNCVCPACNERLIARKGAKMIHHFAHYFGSECEYAYETSLHLLAKDILTETKNIIIPDVYVEFSGSNKVKELVSSSKEISIDKVELEKQFDNVVPDIVVYSQGRPLFIEIYVTHKIDGNKRLKLINKGISTIEIDLSNVTRLISKNELKNILVNDCDEKKWIFNAVANKIHDAFLSACKEYKSIQRGYAIHIDNCPLKQRIWKGRPYANLIDDCMSCKYCISINDSHVWCSGESKISSINDFRIPYKQRIKDSNTAHNSQISKAVNQGRCPYCGSTIKVQNSKYGSFIGCSEFPHCRFKAKINNETGEIILDDI